MKVLLVCFGIFSVVAVATASAVESLEVGLKVKFDVGTDPGAGTSYFFDVPQTKAAAIDAGWSQASRPSNPLPELVLYCYNNKAFCAMYDDTDYVAGLQVAIDRNSFTSNVFDWEKRGFQKWNTTVDGKFVTMYTLSQYFVSAESLKISKEKRLEARDPTRVLQENAVWLTGTDGELLMVSSSEQDIIDQDVFTKQGCVPWMGQHWYYNMSSATPCDAENIYPWFPMTFDRELIATGFMTFGNLPIGTDRDWFERPAQSEVEMIVSNGPQCLYELSDRPGVLTMHIYYTSTPWLITC